MTKKMSKRTKMICLFDDEQADEDDIIILENDEADLVKCRYKNTISYHSVAL